MKITDLNYGDTEHDLKRGFYLLYFVYFVSTFTGLFINILTRSVYPLEIRIIDIFVLSIVIILFVLFRWGKIEIKYSATISAIVLSTDLIVSDFYYVFANFQSWEAFLYRDAFIFSISLILVGIICCRKPIVYLSIAYELMLIVVTILTFDARSINTFISLMLLVFGFSITVMFYNKCLSKMLERKLELQKTLSLQEKELLQKEIKLIKKESEHLHEVLLHKNKELTAKARIIARHNDNYKIILKDIEKLLILDRKDRTKRLLEIKAELDSDNVSIYWESFRKGFNDVHQDFFNNLNTKYPELTSSEKKLAAFIKLGLSSKEIGSLLCNTPASVEVARSRLRKKLKLKRSDNLETVFAEL